MKVVRWIVPALVAVVLALVALIVIRAAGGGSKDSSRRSTSSPAAAAPAKRPEMPAPSRNPERRQTATFGVPRSGRCGEIAVNEHTSCPFARVVVREYDAHPSSSFLARSPVTGLTYTMHCEQAHGVIACHDNSTSTLAFRQRSDRHQRR